MYELEGVPSDEQRVPVGRDTIVELLSDFWREVNRSVAARWDKEKGEFVW